MSKLLDMDWPRWALGTVFGAGWAAINYGCYRNPWTAIGVFCVTGVVSPVLAYVSEL